MKGLTPNALPEAVESALMALEGWAFREIQGGRAIDDVLRDVIEGHTCWSVLGIAAAIAIDTQHVSKTTLALLSCQRLWHIDIRRQIEDRPNMSANLIGFAGLKPTEKNHFEAVKTSNEKKCRRHSLRELTPLFALNHNEDIRRLTREALEQFPDELPFAYQEEKTSAERVEELRSTAEIWAEWGRQENYKASPDPADKSATVIKLENPKADTPEFQAALTQQVERTRELLLWNWVQTTFAEESLCKDLSFTDAILLAKQLDKPDLFSSRVSSGGGDLLLGAVSGVAAAVLCFSDRHDHDGMLWALEVISRSYDTPERSSDVHLSYAVTPWHPCVFVARALAAEIQHGSVDRVVKERLLTLAGHPIETVSLEALKCAFDCWDIDSRFAWSALDLGMRFSIGSRDRGLRSGYGYNPFEDIDSREEILESCIELYSSNAEYPDLTCPPSPWVFISREVENPDNEPTESRWRQADEFWRWDYAPKVLKRAPIDKIMADSARQPQFLRLCEGLLSWTIEKINPPWQKDESKTSHRRVTDLFKWTDELSTLLANVSSYLDADSVQSRFLTLIFAQEDELCADFLAPFINLITCRDVLDAKAVRPDVLKILDFCLDRVLQDCAFKRGGYRDGVLYGFDHPRIVRDLFFISVEKAGGAARFANGCWDEIGIILPLIDKFVRAAGWIPSVASAFLTLCERSGPCYPAELFADQVLTFLDPSNLPGWRGTTLPARIAGLIQVYAEREDALKPELAQKMLRILDTLVDLGDRRSAALQISEAFKDVRIAK